MAKMTIKANRDYITIILDKVINGEYAIPEFQRDFVWSNRAIVEFFDSIIKDTLRLADSLETGSRRIQDTQRNRRSAAFPASKTSRKECTC